MTMSTQYAQKLKTFKEYPNAKIMNNHMGSLITSNEDIMKIILTKLKEENRYFFDSFTTKESISIKVGEKNWHQSREKRYLPDNKDTEKEVIESLEKAKQTARIKRNCKSNRDIFGQKIPLKYSNKNQKT